MTDTATKHNTNLIKSDDDCHNNSQKKHEPKSEHFYQIADSCIQPVTYVKDENESYKLDPRPRCDDTCDHNVDSDNNTSSENDDNYGNLSKNMLNRNNQKVTNIVAHNVNITNDSESNYTESNYTEKLSHTETNNQSENFNNLENNLDNRNFSDVTSRIIDENAFCIDTSGLIPSKKTRKQSQSSNFSDQIAENNDQDSSFRSTHKIASLPQDNSTSFTSQKKIMQF